MRDHCDVVIIGAGPGGSTAAHYLARRGIAVMLLDRCAFPRDKTCGDGLTPRAAAVLQDLGLLSDLLGAGQPILGVDLFAPDGYPTAASIPPRAGLPAPMLVVPRLVLDEVLRRRAVRSGARFEGTVLVTDVERSADGVTVTGMRDGSRVAVTGRVAVVATGAATALLRRLGLASRRPRVMLAARAYYEGVAAAPDRIQIRFDSVPLPGYGWIFPTSRASANVGVGYFPSGLAGRRRPASSRRAFEAFAGSSALARHLGAARRAGPVKAYPLRVDFPDAPTSGDRVLLVGEAAGLVNPLTGEGIDYALESGQMAAEFLADALTVGVPAGPLPAYDRLLRARFERLFTFCRRVREASFSAMLLNRLVRVASRRDDLQRMLVDVVLGNRAVSDRITVGAILRKAFALIR